MHAVVYRAHKYQQFHTWGCFFPLDDRYQRLRAWASWAQAPVVVESTTSRKRWFCAAREYEETASGEGAFRTPWTTWRWYISRMALCNPSRSSELTQATPSRFRKTHAESLV